MNRIKIYLIFLILILSIICINTKIEMLDNINSKTITKKQFFFQERFLQD